MSVDCILFCIQEANFQTRALIVPKIEFENVRGPDLQLLRRESIKNVPVKVLDDRGQVVSRSKVEHLIYQRLFPVSENAWQSDGTLLDHVLQDLAFYADSCPPECYVREADLDWLQGANKSALGGGFDHVANYLRLRALDRMDDKPIRVVESFLVLELRTDQESPAQKLRTVSFDF